MLLKSFILVILGFGLSSCSQNDIPASGVPAVVNDVQGLDDVFGDSITNDGENEKPSLIKNPDIADIMKAGPLGDRSLGSANAPVTMIEYASLTCPYCKKFHNTTFPVLKRDYIDKGKVRYILREFPIGRTSGTAWIVTRCAPKSQYFKLYELYLARQNLWVSQEIRREPIFKLASKVGMTREKFNNCLSNQAIIDGLKWVKARGRRLGVYGTPTFFINGEMVPKILSTDELRKKLDGLLARSG